MMHSNSPLFKRSSSHIPFYHFFQSRGEEHFSPFLTPSGRKWGYQVPLKISIISAFSLFLSFILKIYKFSVPYEHLFLGIVFFLSATPALIHSITSISKFKVNIDVLMTLAAFTSLFLGSGLEGGLLLVLFTFSEALGALIESKAKESIKSLRHLSPDRAYLLKDDGNTIKTPLSSIKINDKIIVKAGDIVPLDGIIISGSAALSLAHLTGEDVPQGKQEGDEAPSGAKVLEGFLTIKISKTHDKSTLTQIIDLISSAQESKPKLQSLIDHWGPRYASSIILIALGIFLLFPLLFSMEFFGETGSLFRSLTFLVTASPCALIIGPPIVYLSALGNLAKRGILIKGSAPLDALVKCKRIIFDKTGTLTTGEFQCHGIFPIKSSKKGDLSLQLSIAHALEKGNSHPLSQAILKYCSEKKIQEVKINSFQKTSGFGVSANIEGFQEKAYFGNLKYIESKLSEEKLNELKEEVAPIKKEGFVLSFLYFDENICYFTFRDSIRANAKKSIQTLQKKHKMQTSLLTGDHNDNAKLVANALGIKDYFGELTPENKLEMVQKYGKEQPTIMVGDGLNDAPALASAHVGIAMGKSGTITAIQASDIILLKDSLAHLCHLFNVSKKTHSTIIQNVSFALGVLVIASIISLFGLVPLWLAVLLHEGSTVVVGLNGLRLLK